jgi:hypothetical protein
MRYWNRLKIALPTVLASLLFLGVAEQFNHDPETPSTVTSTSLVVALGLVFVVLSFDSVSYRLERQDDRIQQLEAEVRRLREGERQD